MIKKFIYEERSLRPGREAVCRKIFENILSEKFPNVKPSWLMNYQTGFLLEIDDFCDTLILAFESDGIQHYEYPKPFH